MYEDLEKKLALISPVELREYVMVESKKQRQLEMQFSRVAATLDMQMMALSKLIEDYSYDPSPDIYAAVSHENLGDIHTDNSFQWFSDYHIIIWYIKVALDYGLEIENIVKKYR